jgi:hypothetical protein
MNPTAIVAALAIAVGFAFPSAAPAKIHCVDGSASEARVTGDDEGPPKFSPAFFFRAMSIDASADGLDAGALPISIESICGLPRALDKQAAQLAGGDGIARITSRTSVWKDGQRLTADQKLSELEGADTVRLRGRLLPERYWEPDEDGNPVPTFSASRVVITD